MNKKGEMGIGTLILFISFILIAAVAAAVLISTTQSVQSKALQVGKNALVEVGTSMSVLELYAEDATTDGTVDYFYQTVKLSSGSNPIKLQDLLFTFSTNTASTSYAFNDTLASLANCSDSSVAGIESKTQFGVVYLLNGASHKDDYLYAGDVATICWKSSAAIAESKQIKSNIIPKAGTPLVVDTMTPQLMTAKRVFIYP